jgi:hypothetical protein
MITRGNETPDPLMDARVTLADEWPGSGAAPDRLAAFYRHAAAVYAAVATPHRRRQREAREWAAECRARAARYAARTDIEHQGSQ